MIAADTRGRLTRHLRSSCLAAGAVVLGLVQAVPQAGAQSLPPVSVDGTASSLEGTLSDPAATDALAEAAAKTSARALKKKKQAAASEASEALNPRAGKITTTVESDTPEPAADLGRDNLRTGNIDGSRAAKRGDAGDTPGIPLGSFILRPSVNTSLNSESTRTSGTGGTGGTDTSRTFLATDLKGTLTSDWSRHQLLITGDGIFQRNISGDAQALPSASLNADLRLDLSDDMIAHLTAGYTNSRESATDPNAVLGAVDQSKVQGLSAGASIERDFGLLRGLAAIDVNRTTYSDVTLSDGTTSSLESRNRTTGNLRVRVGYEISPALVPFLEASAGRSVYDLQIDTSGYARDTKSLGGKAGVQIDLGEKLKGEIGLGYRKVTFADARLAEIDAMVLDASASWSPRRGTDITIGLTTSVEPSVVAAQSGYVNRALTIELTQQVRDQVVAKLSGGLTWRNYRPDGSSSDQRVTSLGAGLAYGLNRYLDLTGTIAWERTSPDTGASTDILRTGIGLTLKR